MKDLTKQEILAQLAMFTGTENYYEHKTFGYGFIHLTDGIFFLRESCKCYWLIDIILSAQTTLREEEFQEWNIVKTPSGTWLITCTDGNESLLFSQNLEFSDFPIDSAVIWNVKNVLLLPSEY